MKNYQYLLVLSIFFIACGPEEKEIDHGNEVKFEKRAEVPVLDYTIVGTLPHDTSSFTEGLLFHNNALFESTGSPEGSNFKSAFGIVDMKTGKINVKAELEKEMVNPVTKIKQHVFGEGIVVLKNKIYQVTYQNQVGFMYDAKTYKKAGEFTYPNKEGWGMTTDGTSIIMSDGTEVLSFFDEKFSLTKKISVTEKGYARDSVNELEFINGFIYANIWMTGDIVKIDPATGNIVGRINLTPLNYDVKNFNPNSLEMNGIAYDATNDKIYITGKAWPKIYEIKFQH